MTAHSAVATTRAQATRLALQLLQFMHRNRLMMHAGINFPPDPNQRSGSLPDRRVIRSLSAFSLAKEDQVNENAQHHRGHDYLLQVFRIKEPRRNCPGCGSTMTAMMIDGGKRVAADGAGLQWHMIPIADIDLIARNTRGEENGVAS